MKMKNKTTIDQVIQHCYDDGFFKAYLSNFFVDRYIVEEAFQEFLLLVVENKEKMIELFDRKEFNYYSTMVIKNFAFNKYSAINKNYGNYHTQLDEIDEGYLLEDLAHKHELAGLIDEIDVFLQKKSDEIDGFWYHKELFELYYYGNDSYRGITRKTKIPMSSVRNSIIYTRGLIVEEFGDNYLKTINE